LEIAGLGQACHAAQRDFQKNSTHFKEMRDLLRDTLNSKIPNLKVNGHPDYILPNTLSVSFPNIKADELLSAIQLQVAASAGKVFIKCNI
jgi:cysteine desulfurase